LDIYLWETTSHDPVSYGLLPLKKLHIWGKIVFLDNYGRLCPFNKLELKYANDDLMFIVNIGLIIRSFFLGYRELLTWMA
jgi:hypothetical protein